MEFIDIRWESMYGKLDIDFGEKIQYVNLFIIPLDTFVTIMCRNDELSGTMSWVGYLLTDKLLPDKWKLRDWE